MAARPLWAEHFGVRHRARLVERRRRSPVTGRRRMRMRCLRYGCLPGVCCRPAQNCSAPLLDRPCRRRRSKSSFAFAVRADAVSRHSTVRGHAVSKPGATGVLLPRSFRRGPVRGLGHGRCQPQIGRDHPPQARRRALDQYHSRPWGIVRPLRGLLCPSVCPSHIGLERLTRNQLG